MRGGLSAKLTGGEASGGSGLLVFLSPQSVFGGTAISSEGAAVYHQDFIECTATDYLKDNYDIIGFDPRDVADSTPVYCGQDSKL